MQKYDRYKDSSIEWLGKIPEHWEVKRFKYVLREINVRSTSGAEKLLSLSKYHGVIPKSDIDERSGGALSLVGYKKVYKDTVVVNKMQAVNGLIGVSYTNGITSPDYSIYGTISDSVNYIGRLMCLPIYLTQYKRVVTGAMEGFIRLYTDDLYNIYSLLPPLPEQQAIAAFLEEKCSKIDEAVRIKQQQIEKLTELRQITIHNAVTKGINPDVEMKHSGIDWIGEIPKHWDFRRFKFLCSITTGTKNTEDKVEDGLFPFFVRSQTEERINTYSFDGEAILTAGDGAGVGKVYHYINGKFDFHQRVYKFSDFNNVIGKYIFHFLSSEFYNVAILGTAKSTVDSLRLPLIQDFIIAFPISITEQQQIVAYLEEKNSKIDAAIARKTEQIIKLNEYKQSLINEVVTGKVKVTN